MTAVLLSRSKTVLPDGAIVEIVIWKVPLPVHGSAHRFKYRLYFGKDDKRIVGFDNERGNGDHCHIAGVEKPYRFTTPETLLADFRSEIQRWRHTE